MNFSSNFSSQLISSRISWTELFFNLIFHFIKKMYFKSTVFQKLFLVIIYQLKSLLKIFQLTFEDIAYDWKTKVLRVCLGFFLIKKNKLSNICLWKTFKFNSTNISFHPHTSYLISVSCHLLVFRKSVVSSDLLTIY